MKILLADDDILNRKVISGILTRRGHQVDLAENGQEAVDMANAHIYQLIIMDLKMPVMDGLEASYAIRKSKDKKKSRTPILALTGNLATVEAKACLMAGMDDIVTKPVGAEELFDKISQVLGEESRKNSDNKAIESGASDAELNSITFTNDMGVEDRSELLDIFLSNCSRLIDSIELAISRGDANALHTASHQLKGSASQYGVTRIADWAYDLETLGKDGNLESAEAICKNLQLDYERIKKSFVKK